MRSDQPEEPPHELDASDAEPEIPDGDDPWEPPGDLDTLISRFNAAQRTVYRVLRAEVGAGAANVIRSCFGCQDPATLGGSELQSDGSWDAEALRNAVVRHRIDEPWPEYERLIQQELETLRAHISSTQMGVLEQQLEQVATRDSA